MSPELVDKLCKEYPNLFPERYREDTKAPITWTINCDDGWFNLIDSFCTIVQAHIQNPSRVVDKSIKNYFKIFWNRVVWNRVLSPIGKFWFAKICPTNEKMKRWIDFYEKLSFNNIDYKTTAPLNVEIVSIKEKYAALRIYVSGEDEYIRGCIDLIERLSYGTCQICGATNKTVKLRLLDGWVKTLCNRHSKNKLPTK